MKTLIFSLSRQFCFKLSSQKNFCLFSTLTWRVNKPAYHHERCTMKSGKVLKHKVILKSSKILTTKSYQSSTVFYNQLFHFRKLKGYQNEITSTSQVSSKFFPLKNYIEKQDEISGSQKRTPKRASSEKPVARHNCSWNHEETESRVKKTVVPGI